MKQLDHYISKFVKKEFPVILVCDNISNAPNIGSLFRTADAFGIKKLILCGPDISLGRRMTKTSRATEKIVKFEIHHNSLEVIKNLKAEKFEIISLEITDTSKAIDRFTFPKSNPIALVIGNENSGISKDVLKLSDAIVHIEMYGQNSSMNVVQAANIALYEITKQLN